MERDEALAAARAVCGTTAWCEYRPDRVKPYRVGCYTWFRNTLACGDSWEEALAHLRARTAHPHFFW